MVTRSHGGDGSVDIAQAKQYWQRELVPPLPLLQGLGRRRDERPSSYSSLEFRLPPELSYRLVDVAGANDLRLFGFLLSAYHLVASYFDICANRAIGTGFESLVVVPGRIGTEPDSQSYLPLRISLDLDQCIKNHVAAVQDQLVRTAPYAHFGLREFSTMLGPESAISLFYNCMLSQDLHDASRYMSELQAWNFGFILCVSNAPGAISGSLTYNSCEIELSCAQRIVECYERILQNCLSNLDGRIRDIPIIDADECEAVRGYSMGATVSRPIGTTVVQLFEAQAAARPHSQAISSLLELDNIYDPNGRTYLNETVTYNNLNGRANQIARTLCEHGVTRNHVVGVSIDHPIHKIEAVLGVMKAGAAYLPIDDRYPADLKKQIVADAEVRIVVAEQSRKQSDIFDDIKVLDINGSEFTDKSTTDLGQIAKPDDLCYVCFTTGTTSRMKGVLVEHRGLLNYATWRTEALNFNERSVTLQLVPFSADGFGANLYPTIICGGTLVIIPESRQSDGEYIRAVLKRFQITNMSLMPSSCRSWLGEVSAESLSTINTLVLAGESASDNLLKELRRIAPHTTIANEYGPTETTIGASLFVGMEVGTSCVIGRPVDNVRVAVLNSRGEPNPVNVPGEICIAGPGVARGYLKDPGLTARKFVKDGHGQRLYRTGDLGTWTEAGNLRYLGRIDRQRKIRGHRTELEYIERRIGEILHSDDVHVRIQGAAATSDSIANGDELMVAYVQANTPSVASDLRQQLAGELPDWMVPSFVVPVDRLVRTDPGRVDSAMLRLPKPTAPSQNMGPRSDLEQCVAELFAKILRCDPEEIGPHSNFFDLGGHSISMTRLAALIHSELRVNLKLSRIYQSPTVASVAELIRENGRGKWQGIPPAKGKQHYDASPAQERMYVMRYNGGNASAYNTPALINWKERIDGERLELALRQLIERHEVFRTAFGTVRGRLKQIIHATVPFELERQAVAPENAQAFLDSFVRPFSLDCPPLVRAALLTINDEWDVIALDSHHIVVDAPSMGIMLRDLKALYDGLHLPPLAFQYKDYVEWRVEGEQIKALEASERYWLGKFGNEVPVLHVPTDFPRTRVKSLVGDFVSELLDRHVRSKLDRIARDNATTHSAIFLSAFAVLLAKWASQYQFVLGLSVSGRMRTEFEEIIGNFAGVVPISCLLHSSTTFRKLLQSMKSEIVNAYENQEYSLDLLVRRLGLKPDSSRNPMFDVVFQFLQSESNDLPEPMTAIPLEGRPDLSVPSNYVFDLVLNVVQRERTTEVTLGYSTSLFQRTTAKLLLSDLMKLLEHISDNEEAVLGKFDLSAIAIRASDDYGKIENQEDFRF